MYKVIKRDGKSVDFELSKISEAIRLAFDACEKQYNRDTIDFLALKVTADFEPKIENESIAVEKIQDSVESVLIKAGYDDVAKAYILYRKQREKVRNIGATMVNYKDIVNDYLSINDWRVKENSTVTYSVGGLILSNSGAITANYWLSEIYDEEIASAHKSAYTRSFDAYRLLRRLVVETAYQRRFGRSYRKNNFRPREAFGDALQPDGKLSRHNAKRMGGSSGVLFL